MVIIIKSLLTVVSQRQSFKNDKPHPSLSLFFFFNDTATTEIYTLSLHDALPISVTGRGEAHQRLVAVQDSRPGTERFSQIRKSAARRPLGQTRSGQGYAHQRVAVRSEEHTSELQSPDHLVCRLLLEKKKKIEDE